MGLVLEGGGFRGLFVEGFTAWLLDHDIHIPYVIGVSMGASNGANYIARQKGRNMEIVEEFIDDPRYISRKNLITRGSLFGMDFIFNDIAYNYNKFDFDTFKTSEQELVVGAMNCLNGQTTYIKKSETSNDQMMSAMRASVSLPFISQLVSIHGKPHLDGGLTDPIPVRKALQDGCQKVLIVSTRDINYVKEAFKGSSIGKVFYRQYPKVAHALKNRHLVYTETQGYIKGLEASNKAMVIRPDMPLPIGRTEKNIKKVKEVYRAGYDTAERNKDAIISFIYSE